VPWLSPVGDGVRISAGEPTAFPTGHQLRHDRWAYWPRFAPAPLVEGQHANACRGRALRGQPAHASASQRRNGRRARAARGNPLAGRAHPTGAHDRRRHSRAGTPLQRDISGSARHPGITTSNRPGRWHHAGQRVGNTDDNLLETGGSSDRCVRPAKSMRGLRYGVWPQPFGNAGPPWLPGSSGRSDPAGAAGSSALISMVEGMIG
jgi:hypothetical protein